MSAEFDNTQAFTEGWGIFETHEDTDASFVEKYGTWSLDRLGEDNNCGPVVFGEDCDEVWRFVVEKANTGSEYHRRAINFLREHNPKEIEFIREMVPEVGEVPAGIDEPVE